MTLDSLNAFTVTVALQSVLWKYNSLLYFDYSKLSAIMSKLLLLKVKMIHIDIPVSEMGTHFQTFSVADEGLGTSTLYINALN